MANKSSTLVKAVSLAVVILATAFSLNMLISGFQGKETGISGKILDNEINLYAGQTKGARHE